jgi:S-adenosylmethionine/arginine decarboxylase-like enzyme
MIGEKTIDSNRTREERNTMEMQFRYPFPKPATLVQAHWNGEPDQVMQAYDIPLLASFQEEHPWGIDTAIDLFDCDPIAIRDPGFIRSFAVDLCETIQMGQYSEPLVIRFGDDPDVCGFTLVQLIETSDIVAHFIEQVNAACLHVFSCSAYSPCQIAAFCQRWFHAQGVQLSVVFRGSRQRIEEEKIDEVSMAKATRIMA